MRSSHLLLAALACLAFAVQAGPTRKSPPPPFPKRIPPSPSPSPFPPSPPPPLPPSPPPLQKSPPPPQLVKVPPPPLNNKKVPPPPSSSNNKKAPPPPVNNKKPPPPPSSLPPPPSFQPPSPSPPAVPAPSLPYIQGTVSASSAQFAALSALTVSASDTKAFGWKYGASGMYAALVSLATQPGQAMVVKEYPDADPSKLGQQVALNQDGSRLYTSAPGGVAVYATTGPTLGAPVGFYPRNGDITQANTPLALFFTAGAQFWVAAYSLASASDVQVQMYRAADNSKFADFNLYGINVTPHPHTGIPAWNPLTPTHPLPPLPCCLSQVFTNQIVWTVASGGKSIAAQAARSAGIQIITLNAQGVQATPQVLVPTTGPISSLSFSPDGLSLSAVIGSRLYVLNVTSLLANPNNLRGATLVNTALPAPMPAFFSPPPGVQLPPPSPLQQADPNAPRPGDLLPLLFWSTSTRCLAYLNTWQAPELQSSAYNVTSRNFASWPATETLQASHPQFNYGGVVGTKLLLQDTGSNVNVWRVSN
ncbi:hypothetical protein QJQ45_028985 [Haematococcus lacustris]|nr:hypothetical protein QJQ45_028985 [Haematococcus lacustris]